MQDIAYLKSKGVSAGAYKKLFTLQPTERPPRLQKLVDLMTSRNNDGYMNCIRDHHAWHAIDCAYELPYTQTTPTMIRDLLRRNPTAEQAKSALESWGLREDELFLDVMVDGKRLKMLNPPVFYQILVPLVKAYVGIRLAKLFNERNQDPLLKFRPMVETSRDQVLCQVWTDLVKRITSNYGTAGAVRQGILQALKYGTCLMFPREEWHSETQIFDLGDGPKKITMKEGIRYTHPHPTRMAYDLHHPATTFNTDTGCEWALHWDAPRWGDIIDNRRYWNRKEVFAGQNWLAAPSAGNYFKEFFPCAMKFPYSGWQSNVTRADTAAFYNNSTDRDTTIFVTNHFMKLIPKDWDLGDYPYHVWHRFIMAGADTVLWAEPSAYSSPIIFMGYDYDETAARNPSLALELIPWQDHVGNILSQTILTAKQNLANIIFYNQAVVNKEDVEKVNNSGERKYRGFNFIGFDHLKLGAMKVDVDKLFHSVNLGDRNLQDMFQLLPLTLTVMERVIQMAAQEVGASGPHQQSKEEIVQTGGASSNRSIFTGSYIDEGMDAMARQHHDGGWNYLDEQYVAQVSTDIANLEQAVTSLGMKVTGYTKNKAIVEGKKRTLRMDQFASSVQGPEPTKEKEMAQAIFSAVGMIASQEALAKAVGPESLLKIVERAAIMAGAPSDFHLEPVGQGQDVPQAIMQAIQQAQQATLQAISEKIAKPAAQEMAAVKQEIAALEQTVKKLEGIYQAAAVLTDKKRIKEEEAAQRMQIRQQEAAAELRRKEEQHHADIQRSTQESHAKIAIETAEAKTRIAVKTKETMAKTEALKAQTEASIAAKTKETNTKVALKEKEAASRKKRPQS